MMPNTMRASYALSIAALAMVGAFMMMCVYKTDLMRAVLGVNLAYLAAQAAIAVYDSCAECGAAYMSIFVCVTPSGNFGA